MAEGRRVTANPVRMAVELQVHEEGRTGTAVSHQVAHQSVYNVWVGSHDYSDHSYSNDLPDSTTRH